MVPYGLDEIKYLDIDDAARMVEKDKTTPVWKIKGRDGKIHFCLLPHRDTVRDSKRLMKKRARRKVALELKEYGLQH